MKDEGASAAAVSRGNRRRGRKSVGAAIKEAGSKPAPKRQTPKPGARSTGKAIQQAGGRLPQIFKPGGGSGRPSPSSSPTGGRNVFTTRPSRSSFTTQRQAARGRVREERSDAVRDGRMAPLLRLPRRPVLEGGYTEAQRQDIIDSTEEAIQDATRSRQTAREKLNLVNSLDESDGPSELRSLGDRETRRALNKYIGATDTRKAGVVDELGGEEAEGLTRQQKIDLFRGAEREQLDAAAEAKPGRQKFEVQAAGVNIPVERATDAVANSAFAGHGASARPWARLFTAPVQTGRAFVEAPGATTSSTAKAAAAAAIGAPAGILRAVTDPAEAWEDTKDSYRRLYEPLMEGNTREFRRQVTEEGAGLQVALDTVGLAAVAGRAAGAVGKAGGARVMTEPRPLLRVGAGPTQVRSQPISPNLFVAAGQRATDRLRAAVADRRGLAEEGMRGLVPGEGEVVRTSLRRQARDQRIAVANRTSRGMTRQRAQQDAEVRSKRGMRGDRRKLFRDAGDRALAADLETLALQGLAGRDVAATRELLEQRRDHVLSNRAPSDADPELTAIDLRTARRDLAAIDRELEQAAAGANVAQGRAEVLSRNLGGVAAERLAERAGNPRARTDGAYAAGGRGIDDAQSVIADLQQGRDVAASTVADAEEAHRIAKSTARRDRRKAKRGAPGHDADEVARIDRVLRHDDDALAQALAAAETYVSRQRDRDARILERDETGLGGHRAELRRWMPLGRTLGEHRHLDEQVHRIERKAEAKEVTAKQADELIERAERQFLARTRGEAARRGLFEPVYVEHRPTARERYADHAPGGSKAIAGPRHTHYRLFDEGRYDVSGRAFDAGLLRTIKRTVNWNTVADLLESSSPADARRLTLREAQDYIHARGLSAQDWDVIDLNVFRRSAPHRDTPGTRAGEGGVDDPAISAALQRATVDLSGDVSAFGQGGATFAVVPRAVVGELRDATVPGSALSRTLQKVQGITASAILSTSPVFVPIQVASNIILAVPGSRGRALTMPYRRWREKIEADGADPETLSVIDEFLGSAPMSDLTRSPHFGASTDNRLARFYQALVDADSVNAARESHLNPLTWNRKLDQHQNDFFRRNAFFARLERDLHRPFNGAVAEAQELADALAMPAGEAKRARLRELEPQIESYARHVDDLLGNWTRYTVRERRLGRSFLLFYGFVRFATKLALYTLPVGHPIAANVVRQLGQLNNDEVVDLLSERFLDEHKDYSRDEVERAIRRELLSQFGGRVYFERDGELGYVDVGRTSPLASPIFNLLADPRSGSFGLLSPVLGSTVSALIGESERGAKLNTRGIFTPFGQKPQIGLGEGARIVARDTLRLPPVFRAIDDATGDERIQGADSLPFVDDRPLRPVSAGEKRRADRHTEGQPDGEVGRVLQSLFTPIRTNDTQSMARVQQSADYPELDKAKMQLRALESKGQGDGSQASGLRARIAILETRAGIRKPHNPDRGSWGVGGSGSWGASWGIG